MCVADSLQLEALAGEAMCEALHATGCFKAAATAAGDVVAAAVMTGCPLVLAHALWPALRTKQVMMSLPASPSIWAA